MSALANTIRQLSGRLALLRAERERYQALCAAAYQLAGTVNAPVRFLDALADGANGEIEARQKTDGLLPVDPQETGCFPAWSDAEVEGWKRDALRYRRLKTFAHPSYNMKQMPNWESPSLSKEEFLTIHAGSWEAMDAVLDGVLTVNTVNIMEQS
jgi:hypothetical protein